MFKELLAKSEQKDKTAETIKKHTDELISRLEILRGMHPNALTEREWLLLEKACYYHDIGKANTKFQNKVHPVPLRIMDEFENLKEVSHGYLSCAYIPIDELEEELSYQELCTLMKAVYYHHEREKEDFTVSETIVENDLPKYIPLLEKQGFNVRKELVFDYGEFVDKYFADDQSFYDFVKIKGFLNKIDFTASAHTKVEIEPENLVEKVDHFLNENELDPNNLQNYLKEHQDENHVIIASTGIGKTEAALYWIGKNKGIFTLPLKVSINAIYDRLTNILNLNNVGLLHSDTVSEYLKRSEEQDNEFDLKFVEQTKKFSNPLTVCTLDQIIDFVGLYPGFEIKLAILSYSKLVIDEIQMYSPKLAAFIILGLKHITNVGGEFLIMTATFPPLLEEEMKRLNIPFHKREEPFLKLDENGQVMKRHYMKIKEQDISAADIVQEGIAGKVLIIVNTVTKAQKLQDDFDHLEIKTNLLHSRFIKKDRDEKEEAIKFLGREDVHEEGIWITTQLVEASVDIDFDVLFTELSEATGLFQRMGRVYRKRIYRDENPNVFVYTGNPYPSGVSNSTKSVVDFDIFNKSKEVLLEYDNQLLSEQHKMDIVKKIYTTEALKGSNYLSEFKKTIQRYSHLLAYEDDQKPSLRDIQNVNIIPTCVYAENEAAILDIVDKLKKETNWTKKIKFLDQIKEFVVAIPHWAFINASNKRLIDEPVYLDKRNSYPVIAFKYTKERGLIYDIDFDAMFM